MFATLVHIVVLTKDVAQGHRDISCVNLITYMYVYSIHVPLQSMSFARSPTEELSDMDTESSGDVSDEEPPTTSSGTTTETQPPITTTEMRPPITSNNTTTGTQSPITSSGTTSGTQPPTTSSGTTGNPSQSSRVTVTTISGLKAPPVMKRKGRPRGNELTSIGLPSKKAKKQATGKPCSFSKMHSSRKEQGKLYAHTWDVYIVISNLDLYIL